MNFQVGEKLDQLFGLHPNLFNDFTVLLQNAKLCKILVEIQTAIIFISHVAALLVWPLRPFMFWDKVVIPKPVFKWSGGSIPTVNERKKLSKNLWQLVNPLDCNQIEAPDFS
jgi:hypothetical protein